MSIVARIFPALLALASSANLMAGSLDSVVASNGNKSPTTKTVTNFSQSLRCMDELFLAFGKRGIVITSAGIPDETGKVRLGTKEMVISAISKMSLRSNAFDFIDYHSQADDLSNLFSKVGDDKLRVPDFYIRGAITQMDDDAVRKNKGAGISLPFLDFSFSKDEQYDLMSVDVSMGEVATRRLLPLTNTSNTMMISKASRSGEGGGKIGKAGLSFNLDISRSEGLGASTRALIELTLIETMGKFTQVPYWRCLDIDAANPVARATALEAYEVLKDAERITFMQRKLGGSMQRYKGPIDGKLNNELKQAIAEYQSAVGLTSNGQLNFETYYSLLDDTQNVLAELPAAPPVLVAPPPVIATTSPPAPHVTDRPKTVESDHQPSTESAFQLTLQSDRGLKPSYKIGEELKLSIALSSNGIAYCYYEDVHKKTARIFPNQFYPNSNLKAGAVVQLPAGGFKIRFDTPGRERISCVAADHELIVPTSANGAKDLTPLSVSLNDIIGLYKLGNTGVSVSTLDISVHK